MSFNGLIVYWIAAWRTLLSTTLMMRRRSKRPISAQRHPSAPCIQPQSPARLLERARPCRFRPGCHRPKRDAETVRVRCCCGSAATAAFAERRVQPAADCSCDAAAQQQQQPEAPDVASCATTAYAIVTAAPIPTSGIPPMHLWKTPNGPPSIVSLVQWPNALQPEPAAFSEHQLERIALFQTRFWDMVVRQPPTLPASQVSPKTPGMPQFSANAGGFYGVPEMRQYEIIPMTSSSSQHSSNLEWQIDWEMLEFVCAGHQISLYRWMAAAFPLLHRLPVDETTHQPCAGRCQLHILQRIAAFQDDHNAAFEHDPLLASPDIRIRLNQLLMDMVVETPSNSMRYRLTGCLFDKNAHSSFSLVRSKQPLLTKFIDYVQRVGYVVSHPDVFLVQAQGISNIRSFLRSSAAHDSLAVGQAQPAKATAVAAKSSSESRKTSELVPDACCVIPLSHCMIESLHLLPSILFRLDSYCHAADFDATLGRGVLPDPDAHMPVHTLRMAFVASGAHEDVNYERLETLGDSFLKFGATLDLWMRYPNCNEGELSILRAHGVSNWRLFQAALKFDLAGLMTTLPFSSRYWSPPNTRPWRPTNPFDSDLPTPRQLSQKMLADLVEAVVGAYFLEGGQQAGMAILERLGLIQHAPATLMLHAAQDHDALALDLQAADMVRQIETSIGHTFTRPSLLVQAMTHSSYDPSAPNYQRLEFLGDAVIDCFLSRHFYLSYPSITPGILTDLRQALVCNESFCRLSVRLGLHRHIRSNSPLMQKTSRHMRTTFSQARTACCRRLTRSMKGQKSLETCLRRWLPPCFWMSDAISTLSGGCLSL
ncbi:hypothetical protein BC831DRAFT_156802 [Entophlyctis helioformis]|nr:hypothetical protein BC831DRAFT_156802 [Entophlyctis helioformis]